MKITKLAVDKLPIPSVVKAGVTAQKRYYDDVMKGFGVRVTSGGSKAFFVEKLINGKLSRITLGRYPELTVEMARREAQKVLGQIAMGLDPLAEKRSSKLKEITLEKIFNDYLEARKSLKPKTIYDYKRSMELAFKKWRHVPFTFITKEEVVKQHTFLGKKHGAAYADQAMAILRALFNFASVQYEDSQGRSLISENPVKRLSQTRAWFRVGKRTTYIKSHELAAWYQGAMSLSNTTLRDYLILVVMTGLRRQEAARLKWEQVDFRDKTITITDTKNHQDHTLPLSDYLYTLLANRKQSAINAYVFPGSGAGGYIIEPRKQMVKVVKSSGVHFTIHDLRRTFITVAEGLDIAAYALKRLLNHKMNNDITAGYIMNDIERLRKPMQLITDTLVKLMGINELAPNLS
ncbi:MAG: integrase arm-type DNA-binding domain-containing protein [Rickettsiella sp.]|nr:integrase arm-type DNA-binding domain-containing protein [Rickettsiella sp.]